MTTRLSEIITGGWGCDERGGGEREIQWKLSMEGTSFCGLAGIAGANGSSWN